MSTIVQICFTILNLLCAHGFLQIPSTNHVPALPSLAEPPVTIASFNIQIFGQTKYNKLDVRNTLLQILSKYDIVIILEIRDSTETVFEKMRHDLNTLMTSRGLNVSYSGVVSGRLGRSSSKEQYGFLFRSSRVALVDSYQMTDPNDEFEREPFGVKFHSPSTVLKEFGLIGIHIKPSMVVEEMNLLPKTFETFKQHWEINDLLVAGDFNADCLYFTNDQWPNITIRNDPNYTWLIEDGVDTTVAPARCSYDRLIARGKFANSIVPDSISVYRFDEEMHMNKSQGLRVSDHYPIELQLQGTPHVAPQQHLETTTSFIVKDLSEVSSINAIRRIYRKPSCAPSQFTIKLQMEDTHMDFVTATVSDLNADGVMSELKAFYLNCNDVLSLNLLGMVDAYMKSDYLSNSVPQVYGLVKSHQHTYGFTIKCWLTSPNVCEAEVRYKISGL